MEPIEYMMIIDDPLMPIKPMGATLKGKVSGKLMGSSRFGEKPEGALDKLHFLFRREKRKDQKNFEYYLDLVRKEPENTLARLKLAEIYRRRGEKRKAIFAYFRTSEIFSRKRLYPQAVAIYKRIQKHDPSLQKALKPGILNFDRKYSVEKWISSFLEKKPKY